MKRIQKIINHWSDSGPATTVETIRKWHKAKGWRDIGYHRVILHPMAAQKERPKEKLEWWHLVKQGRPLDMDWYIEDFEVGAHTLGHNGDGVGICIISQPGAELHPLQKEAIIKTNLTLVARFNLHVSDIYGHRDFNATMCPGPDIYEVVKQLRQNKHKL